MLADQKLEVLQELIRRSSREELIWTNGYLAGLLAQNKAEQPVTIQAAVTVKPTIIYGTETGNSKKLASQLQTLLKKNKIQSKVIDAFQYPIEKLDKEDYLIVIMSTQGEGDPPQNAVKFFDNISNSSVGLSKTRFAVLGLGDSSYPLFCKAGEDIDQQLLRLGGQQAIPFQKADVDFAPVAENWFAQILESLQKTKTENTVSAKTNVVPEVQKKNYTGIVRHKVILNDRGSNKETHHIEIETDEPVAYEPGDAIGFYPENNKDEIQEIAGLLREDSRSTELRTKNIRGLSRKSLEAFSKLFEVDITEEKADLLDILKKYPVKKEIAFDAVLAVLHPIAPRLYSIASAVEAHDDAIHITVNRNVFSVDGVLKSGLCSQFLSDYPKDSAITFYIHKNKNFRLPDPDKDVIMIGPGTGIAPFRSFLAHRDATGAEGKNWLFFGEQHFVSDFYYQTEIQEWLATGVLTQLDTAFSRDQKHKIYVQDRLKQKANEVYQWLENGAYLYICGQKNPMSADVENALLEIIATEKNTSIANARTILDNLETEGRYLKDVY